MKFSENWLRQWVNPALTSKELAAQLTMAGLEVASLSQSQADQNETLIEIDLTPNRGDCLSILGMAREIAALNNLKLNSIEINPIASQIQDKIEVEIQAASDCPRYVGRLIRNIKSTAQTPAWIVERLAGSDIGAIHPVVDILNYVMVELGQPMHAFDADKIKGSIIVRHAKSGEKITLLDGQEMTLKDKTLVIADQSGPVAIAGIMGGNDSAVSNTTKHIFLESALFTPVLMAGKARLYGLHTDSSFRFERGVDPNLQAVAIERASHLIAEICGGEMGPTINVVKEQYLPKPVVITLRLARLHKMLGEPIKDQTVIDILRRLHCTVSESNGDSSDKIWQVCPSSFRYDLTAEIDLIEEVVRVLGYNTITNTMPHITSSFISQSEKTVSISRVKRAFVDMGYQEVITYSFVDGNLQKQLFPERNALALLNPISADMGEMRLSLWPGLLSTLKYNQNRQQNRMKFFEVGLCFNFVNHKLEQENRLGGLVCGDFANESWGIKNRSADFFDVKQSIESLWLMLGNTERLKFTSGTNPACHPGQCADIMWQDKKIGVLGKLHPKLEKQLDLAGPIYLFELSLSYFTQSAIPTFHRPSRFPEIRRDIAVIVDEKCLSDSLINFVSKSAGEILRDVKIFDVYTGKGIDSGRKSVAMGLILQHASRTLVDKEVDEVVHNIVAGLKKEFSAELRD